MNLTHKRSWFQVCVQFVSTVLSQSQIPWMPQVAPPGFVSRSSRWRKVSVKFAGLVMTNVESKSSFRVWSRSRRCMTQVESTVLNLSSALEREGGRNATSNELPCHLSNCQLDKCRVSLKDRGIRYVWGHVLKCMARGQRGCRDLEWKHTKKSSELLFVTFAPPETARKQVKCCGNTGPMDLSKIVLRI